FVFDLLAKGDVSGLRIDHVDGLWEPREYLQRLQERYSQLHRLPSGAPGLYLVVEKILDLGHEALPDDWPVHGTTGYDFVNQAVQLFVDSAAEKRMTKTFERFTGLRESFADLCYEKKMLTMQISLSSEIAALGNAFVELSEMHRNYRDFSTNMLVAAVGEVMASFPVYRTYLAEDAALSSADERVILRAILAARRRNTSIEKSVLDFLRGVLLLRLPENSGPEQRDAYVRFVMKFQQSSGPIMAKGVEDTAFYIYNRLVALNEVGGKPEQFGMSLPEFHRLNSSRAERWPHSMLGTSTHDTKRSEDVRLRIASLSEIPEMWDKAVRRWSKWNAKYRTKVDDESSPSRNEEYLLYQTLVGSWPLEPLRGDERAVYVQRIQAYMIKALKEAKINSSWIEPNEEWEKATINFVGRILDEKAGVKFCADLSEIANLVAQLGALNSLVQTVLKCTVPGVPDFYQGTEIWDFSLVDPDNRRPVDYSKRTHLLDSLSEAQPNQLMMEWRSGRVKLFVTQRLLRFRAENPSLFQEGGYHEVPVVGKRADHIVAFERKRDTQRLLVVVPRLSYTVGLWPIGGAWEGTFLLADAEEGRKWHDVFTQKTVALTGNQHDLPAILSDLPFAVLYQGERSC
ncbi:MAG TPA: malto-oligosyltrehalose synthase, partial [Terrimicrobiaceae bacterium]